MATYTPEQLERRNNSKWTMVQAVLAPLQFLMFIISFSLVVRYLVTGNGFAIANSSVLIKITLLWLITVTGMIWEKKFLATGSSRHSFLGRCGQRCGHAHAQLVLFARWQGWSEQAIMMLMLLAYVSYMFNCAQFILKGLQTRKQRRLEALPSLTAPQMKVQR